MDRITGKQRTKDRKSKIKFHPIPMHGLDIKYVEVKHCWMSLFQIDYTPYRTAMDTALYATRVSTIKFIHLASDMTLKSFHSFVLLSDYLCGR